MSQRVADALIAMDQRFPASKMTGATARAYLEDLADLPDDAVVAAIAAVRKSSEFLPTVRAIREMAVEIMGEAEGFWVTPQAAWEEALANVRAYGLDGTRVTIVPDPDHPGYVTEREVEMAWSSPVVARAVEQFGWRELCLMEIGGTEERTMFAQFRDTVVSVQGQVRRSLVTGRAMASGRVALPEPRDDMTAIGDVIAGMIPDRATGNDERPQDAPESQEDPIEG